MTTNNFENVLSSIGLKLEHYLATLYQNRDWIFAVSQFNLKNIDVERADEVGLDFKIGSNLTKVPDNLENSIDWVYQLKKKERENICKFNLKSRRR